MKMKVKLGDIAILINGDRGKNYPSQADIVLDGDVPFVNAGHLNGRNINFSEMNYISKEKYAQLNSGKFREGDILYCLRGSLGKKAVVNSSIQGAIASSLVIIRPDSMRVDVDYLMFALDSPSIQEQLIKANNGSSQPNLSAASVRGYEVDLPDKKIQEDIVDKLSKVRAIIDARQQELQKLDDLIKARFVEMFGDTVTNSMNWEEHVLSEYIVFLTSGSRGWAQYFTDESGEVFITIKNVKNNHINLDNVQYIMAPNNKEAERTKVQAGDLLISITADLGRTGVVDEDIASKGAYINQHLSLVRLDSSKISPLYVSYFLETEGGKRQFESRNQNGVKAGLNFDAIKSLRILVPDKKLQEEYLQFVKQVDKSKVVIQKALDETQLLFDSLMQKYFG